MIVAALAVLALGETLGQQAAFALLLISLGVMSLALSGGRDAIGQPKTVLAALATACFIAGYTVVDGTGA